MPGLSIIYHEHLLQFPLCVLLYFVIYGYTSVITQNTPRIATLNEITRALQVRSQHTESKELLAI